jgi:hypothetical protein
VNSSLTKTKQKQKNTDWIPLSLSATKSQCCRYTPRHSQIPKHLKFNCDFFLKSNSPKKVRSHIDHSKSTNHKRHFCQRDHGSISHLFSSRLVSKFYSRSQKKLKFYHKTRHRHKTQKVLNIHQNCLN